MAYRSAKKRKQDKNFRTALWLMATAFAIIGGASYFYMQLLDRRVLVDEESMCPVEGVPSISAVLIDSTDPFSAVQQEYLRKYLDELLESLEVGALIQVYSASTYSGEGFYPDVSLCNPGDGAEASEWTANPEKMRRKWEQLFDEPLRRTIEASIGADKSNTSPLMSMLQALSIQAFPLSEKSIPLNLIVISDMLEHTDKYSQYTENGSFPEFASRPMFSHITPNLSQVEVTIIYVARPGLERIQTTEHANFWAQYFNHFGARVRRVKRI